MASHVFLHVVRDVQGGAKNEHPLGQPTLLDPTYIKHQKKLYPPPTHLFI